MTYFRIQYLDTLPSLRAVLRTLTAFLSWEL